MSIHVGEGVFKSSLYLISFYPLYTPQRQFRILSNLTGQRETAGKTARQDVWDKTTRKGQEGQ